MILHAGSCKPWFCMHNHEIYGCACIVVKCHDSACRIMEIHDVACRIMAFHDPACKTRDSACQTKDPACKKPSNLHANPWIRHGNHGFCIQNHGFSMRNHGYCMQNNALCMSIYDESVHPWCFLKSFEELRCRLLSAMYLKNAHPSDRVVAVYTPSSTVYWSILGPIAAIQGLRVNH